MEHKDLWLVMGLTVLLAVTVSLSTVSLTGDAIFGLGAKTTQPTASAKNVLTSTSVNYLSLNNNAELLKTQIFHSKERKPRSTTNIVKAPVCIFMDIANNPDVIGKTGIEACGRFLNGNGDNTYTCTATVFNMIYAYYNSTDGSCNNYKSTDTLTQIAGGNAGNDDPCSYILRNSVKTITPTCSRTSSASQPNSLDMSASELDRGVWCCKTE